MLYSFHPTLFLKGERRQQQRDLEIGASERLRPIFETKNRIFEIGSCERAFRRTKSSRTFLLYLYYLY